MSSHVHELIHHIDQLVFWLREHPSESIPASEKKRLSSVLRKIKECQEISDKEWEAMQPKQKTNPVIHPHVAIKPQKRSRTLNKPTKETAAKKRKIILPLRPIKTERRDEKPIIINGKRMIACPFCKVLVREKNLAKHKRKCKAQNVSKRKPNSTKSKRVKSQRTNSILYTDKKYFNEYKEERKLDGSRDYWPIRERGKFGSHSSYDDMNDEAFS